MVSHLAVAVGRCRLRESERREGCGVSRLPVLTSHQRKEGPWGGGTHLKSGQRLAPGLPAPCRAPAQAASTG